MGSAPPTWAQIIFSSGNFSKPPVRMNRVRDNVVSKGRPSISGRRNISIFSLPMVKFSGVFVKLLHYRQRISAVRRPNPVVAENRDIDAGLILLLEQAVEIENRFRRLRMEPTLGRQMGVTVDDHGNNYLSLLKHMGRVTACQIVMQKTISR